MVSGRVHSPVQPGLRVAEEVDVRVLVHDGLWSQSPSIILSHNLFQRQQLPLKYRVVSSGQSFVSRVTFGRVEQIEYWRITELQNFTQGKQDHVTWSYLHGSNIHVAAATHKSFIFVEIISNCSIMIKSSHALGRQSTCVVTYMIGRFAGCVQDVVKRVSSLL